VFQVDLNHQLTALKVDQLDQQRGHIPRTFIPHFSMWWKGTLLGRIEFEDPDATSLGIAAGNDLQ
jgi:hypothetical protein